MEILPVLLWLIAAAQLGLAQNCCDVTPGSVPLDKRDVWCRFQRDSCTELCGSGGTTFNDCFENTLQSNCVCQSGTNYNLSDYTYSLGSFMCHEWKSQCTAGAIAQRTGTERCDAPTCGQRALASAITVPAGASNTSPSSPSSTLSSSFGSSSLATGTPGASPPDSSDESEGISGGSRKSKGLGKGARAGIGVGISLIVVTGFAILYWFRRRKSKKFEYHRNTVSRGVPELQGNEKTGNDGKKLVAGNAAVPPAELPFKDASEVKSEPFANTASSLAVQNRTELAGSPTRRAVSPVGPAELPPATGRENAAVEAPSGPYASNELAGDIGPPPAELQSAALAAPPQRQNMPPIEHEMSPPPEFYAGTSTGAPMAEASSIGASSSATRAASELDQLRTEMENVRQQRLRLERMHALQAREEELLRIINEREGRP